MNSIITSIDHELDEAFKGIKFAFANPDQCREELERQKLIALDYFDQNPKIDPHEAYACFMNLMARTLEQAKGYVINENGVKILNVQDIGVLAKSAAEEAARETERTIKAKLPKEIPLSTLARKTHHECRQADFDYHGKGYN